MHHTFAQTTILDKITATNFTSYSKIIPIPLPNVLSCLAPFDKEHGLRILFMNIAYALFKQA